MPFEIVIARNLRQAETAIPSSFFLIAFISFLFLILPPECLLLFFSFFFCLSFLYFFLSLLCSFISFLFALSSARAFFLSLRPFGNALLDCDSRPQEGVAFVPLRFNTAFFVSFLFSFCSSFVILSDRLPLRDNHQLYRGYFATSPPRIREDTVHKLSQCPCTLTTILLNLTVPFILAKIIDKKNPKAARSLVFIIQHPIFSIE